MPLHGVMHMSDADIDDVCTQLLPAMKEIVQKSRDEMIKSVEAFERSK